MDVKALEPKNHKGIYDKLEGERQVTDLDFDVTPDKLKGEYLDVYEGARSEILHTTKLAENSD